jgi:hypothetical protein
LDAVAATSSEPSSSLTIDKVGSGSSPKISATSSRSTSPLMIERRGAPHHNPNTKGDLSKPPSRPSTPNSTTNTILNAARHGSNSSLLNNNNNNNNNRGSNISININNVDTTNSININININTNPSSTQTINNTTSVSDSAIHLSSLEKPVHSGTVAELLGSPSFVSTLCEFLQETQDEGLIELWMEIQGYKKTIERLLSNQARTIYNKYFGHGAKYKLELDRKLTNDLKDKVVYRNPDYSTFSKIEADVLNIIKNQHLPKFSESGFPFT